MSEVRTCTPADLPHVAELYRRVFRNGAAMSTEALSAYLHDIYFGNPWYDEAIASRVFVTDDGIVGGFIGVLPIPLAFEGRPVRGALACSLMVGDPVTEPFAGVRLLRSLIAGPQEVTISDSANSLSRTLVERLSGHLAPLASLDWLRILRPTAFLAGRAAARLRAFPERALRPFTAAADRVARRHFGERFKAQECDKWRVEAIDAETVARLMPAWLAPYRLHPDWTADAAAWLLAQAARKERDGPLNRCLVSDGAGRPLGAFLYYGRPQGMAEVLQIMARPGAQRAVVDSMMAWMDGQGFCAVRGRTQPILIDELFRHRCLFRHRTAAVYHTRDPALLGALRAGDACIGGLVGESWARWVSDAFTA